MTQDEPVEITDYNPQYVGRYRAERDRLRIATGIATLKFEHIGSTAVPGLAGRPIVDLMLGAPAFTWAALDELRARIVALGYEDLGDGGVPGCVTFRRRTKLRAFDLVLVEEGGAQWRENVAVREYLKAHQEEVRAYGDAKRSAVARGATTLLVYSEAKRSTLKRLRENGLAFSDQTGRT